jgi:hypothetical protein
MRSHVAILALERGLDPPHCMQCLFNHALCITRAENTIHPYLDLTYYFRYTLCISLFPEFPILARYGGRSARILSFPAPTCTAIRARSWEISHRLGSVAVIFARLPRSFALP